MRPWNEWPLWLALAVLVGVPAGGCAARSAMAVHLVPVEADLGIEGPEPSGDPDAHAPAGTDGAAAGAWGASKVAAEPLAYLEHVAGNCARLTEYRLTLVRAERRGLLAQLHGPERIACWFRREPFSVRMKWLDDHVKYGECAYVAGTHENQVRFVPRRGFLGLRPGIAAADVQTPVLWGETRYPVTDFGLERMVQRALTSIREAAGQAHIRWVGLARLPGGRLAHHIRVRFADGRRPAIHDLYVDQRTDLPACAVLRHEDGRLEAVYLYQDLHTDVRLGDEDFLLEAERQDEGRAGGHPGLPGAETLPVGGARASGRVEAAGPFPAAQAAAARLSVERTRS